MAGKKAEMQKLKEERERLVRQIEALENELKGLDRAIALVSGNEQLPGERTVRERARNVKDTVLGLLAEAGKKGLTVNEVLDAARARNISLERGTVSSLLSRLKREETLEMENGAYFVRPPQAGETSFPKTTH
jgi:hypothetical protein